MIKQTKIDWSDKYSPANVIEIQGPFGKQVHVHIYDGESIISIIGHGGHMCAWLVINNECDGGIEVEHHSFTYWNKREKDESWAVTTKRGIEAKKAAWTKFYSFLPHELNIKLEKMFNRH